MRVIIIITCAHTKQEGQRERMMSYLCAATRVVTSFTAVGCMRSNGRIARRSSRMRVRSACVYGANATVTGLAPAPVAPLAARRSMSVIEFAMPITAQGSERRGASDRGSSASISSSMTTTPSPRCRTRTRLCPSMATFPSVSREIVCPRRGGRVRMRRNSTSPPIPPPERDAEAAEEPPPLLLVVFSANVVEATLPILPGRPFSTASMRAS